MATRRNLNVKPAPMAQSLPADGMAQPRAHGVARSLHVRFSGKSGTERRLFADGYDLDAESQVLAQLLGAPEIDSNDPLYPRYEVYADRLQQWERLKAEHSERAHANAEVPMEHARKAGFMGSLQSESEDSMTLHTLEAMRLYLGVSPEPGSNYRFGVPGGRRAATALRQLFLLSAHDNPYADLALCETDRRISEIKRLIEKVEANHMRMLDDARRKGLNYGVLSAKKTQDVSLGYHSPYGYSVSHVIALYDHCVRVVKSAERRDLTTRAEVHSVLTRVKRECRSMFEAAISVSRILLDERMRGLSRSDFLPQANELALKRIAAAVQLIGVLPQDVFTRALTPRHSLNTERLTGSELAVLQQIALKLGSEPESVKELDGQAVQALVD